MGRHGLRMRVGLIAILAGAMPALAEPHEPVKAIMDLASAMWSNTAPEGSDYFDAAHLRLFSKSFNAAYRDAKKYAYLEDGGLFEYDVVTNSQEGCPLKDVSMAPAAEQAGITTVTVTFKAMSCYQDETVSEVRFKVVTEDGTSVIADLDRIVDGKPVSLVAEMKTIAQEGASPPATQQE